MGVAVLAVLMAGALLSAAPARADDFVIRATPDGVQALGPFALTSSPTLRRAMVAFGRPSSRRTIYQGNGCRVLWRRLGLRIEFDNYGFAGAHKTACTPSVGLAQQAAIGGPNARRWTTAEGLRIGSPLDAVTTLYPGAQAQPDGSWWLITGQTAIGCEGSGTCPSAILSARTDGAAVTSLRAWIGAAGD
jgi:hypothetical protein